MPERERVGGWAGAQDQRLKEINRFHYIRVAAGGPFLADVDPAAAFG
jgi:hypothetical protein